MIEAAELGPGEIGFITAQIKQVADTHVGDTITDDKRPTAEPLPGFKPAQPVVFCGLFPTDAADFEASARGARQAAAERCELLLRDGDLGGARLRLPLRLSRAAASRDHPGAAGARVQSRPDRDRAVGDLPHRDDRQDDDRAAQSRRHARRRQNRRYRGALDQGDDPDARRISRRGAEAVPGSARDPGRAQLCRQARDGDLRSAAQRSRVRLLRPAEIDLEGLCQVRLRADRLPRRRPRQDVDPGQCRAGRCALDAGPPRSRRSRAAARWWRS